jgi:hypothetical protein
MNEDDRLNDHNQLRDKFVAKAYSVVGYHPLHTSQGLKNIPHAELVEMYAKQEAAMFVLGGGKAWEYMERQRLAVELEDERQKVAMLEVIS